MIRLNNGYISGRQEVELADILQAHTNLCVLLSIYLEICVLIVSFPKDSTKRFA